MNIRSNTITINPTNMSSDDQIVLAYFFRHAPSAELYEKDGIYVYPEICSSNLSEQHAKIMLTPPYSELVRIKFTHPLIRRERHSNTGYRYDVYGDKIGEGGYGSVFDILGTLELTHDGSIILQKNIHRVGKQMQYDAKFIQMNGPEAVNEYVTGKAVSGLHMHKPVFYSVSPSKNPYEKFISQFATPTQTGMVVMRYVSGDSLRDALRADGSVDDRLKIAVAAMRSLHRIHQGGIVHRDIKPDNMKVERQKSKIKVNWFDFNGSRLANVNDEMAIFTPYYESPEVHLKQMQTFASDVFSVACMIARDIFDADENPAKSFREKISSRLDDRNTSSNKAFKLLTQAAKKQKDSAVKCKFNNMFNGKVFNELSKEHKKLIKEKLSKMVTKNPNNRPCLDDAIMLFEQIIWERRLDNSPANIRASLLYAKSVAEQLPMRIKCSTEKATKAVDRPGAAMNAIVKAFAVIDKNPAVIAVFADYLDTNLFSGVITEDEFHRIVNSLSNDLDNVNCLAGQFKVLNLIIAQLRVDIKESLSEHPSYHALNNRLQWLEQSMISSNRKIDRMFRQDPMAALSELTTVNEKLERYYAKITKAITSLSSDIQSIKQAEQASKAASGAGVLSTVSSFIGSFFGGGSISVSSSAANGLSRSSDMNRRPS